MNGEDKGVGPCTTSAQGGVGESGASSLVHVVAGRSTELVLLEVTESSLCPNTGATAMLVVDGVPESHGVLSPGHSVQADVKPGQNVIGIVHTYPLFNEIMCIRLGELEFQLKECALVG